MIARIVLRNLKITPRLFLQTRKLSEHINVAQNADKIVRSLEPDIEIPNISIPETIFEKLDKWADKTAVVSRRR